MSLPNKLVDGVAIGGGFSSATLAFFTAYIGVFAQIVGVIVALLTAYVLIQRIRINRRELEKRD